VNVFLKISRKLSYTFIFLTVFVNVQKEESKPLSPLNRREKMKKLSQILRAYNSQMHETILGMLGAEIYSCMVWCTGLLGHMIHYYAS